MPQLLVALEQPAELEAVCTELGQPPPIPLGELERPAAEAIHQAIAAVHADPSDAGGLGHLGMVYHAHRMIDHAAAAYQRAADIDPDNARWAHGLGLVRARQGRSEAAVAAFERARELDDSLMVADLHLGQLHCEGGQYAEAVSRFRSYLARRPQEPYAHLGLGQVALARGDVQNAVTHLETAARLPPVLGRAGYLLGMAYRAAGRSDDARTVLNRAGRLPMKVRWPDPFSDEVDLLVTTKAADKERARLAMARRDYDTALQIALRLTAREADEQSWLRLAKVYRELEQYDEAERAVRRALQVRPGFERGLVWLATLQHGTGRPDKALHTAEQVIAVHSGSADAWIVRAHAQHALGRHDQAIASMRQVTRYRPEAVVHWTTLGEWLAEQLDYDGACAAYARALQLSPSDAAISGRLAELQALSASRADPTPSDRRTVTAPGGPA